VAADVLADMADPALAVEHGRGVDCAGRAEQALVLGDELRHAPQQLEWHRRRRRHGLEAGAHVVELIAPAPPAARRRRTEAWGGRGRQPIGLDGDDVELGLGRAARGAVAHAGHRCAGEQALGVAEADRQVEVVTGGAHRRRDGDAVELDRHRLLDDQLVGDATDTVGCHRGDHHPASATATHPFQVTGDAGRVVSLPCNPALSGTWRPSSWGPRSS
jgi:hypothetical protein